MAEIGSEVHHRQKAAISPPNRMLRMRKPPKPGGPVVKPARQAGLVSWLVVARHSECVADEEVVVILDDSLSARAARRSIQLDSNEDQSQWLTSTWCTR